jgi:hypothetical protein
VTFNFSFDKEQSRFQWPCRLRHVRSLTARTLGSWIRIPLEGCTYAFICVVLSCVGRGLDTGRFPVQGVLTKYPKIDSQFQKSNSESEQARGPNPNHCDNKEQMLLWPTVSAIARNLFVLSGNGSSISVVNISTRITWGYCWRWSINEIGRSGRQGDVCALWGSQPSLIGAPEKWRIRVGYYVWRLSSFLV